MVLKILGSRRHMDKVTSQEAMVGAFSMEEFAEDYTTQVNSKDMSKLISKMDSL